MKHRYSLDGSTIEVDVLGDTRFGDDDVLAQMDDDLTRDTSWAADGFSIEPFIGEPFASELLEGIRRMTRDACRSGGLDVPDEFALADYHRHVTSDGAHLAAMNLIRLGWSTTEFPVDVRTVEDRVSRVVGAEVTAINTAYGVDRWHIRVVRPGAHDYNPLHRDVWLDRLRNAVNLYVPLAGSDSGSSLPLVPGSHRWPESDIARTASGATVDGRAYTVPAVVDSRRPLDLVRPNPPPGSMMLFSPYLVHGGATNRNADRTRVSLEMRFWRRGGPARS